MASLAKGEMAVCGVGTGVAPSYWKELTHGRLQGARGPIVNADWKCDGYNIHFFYYTIILHWADQVMVVYVFVEVGKEKIIN